MSWTPLAVDSSCCPHNDTLLPPGWSGTQDDIPVSCENGAFGVDTQALYDKVIRITKEVKRSIFFASIICLKQISYCMYQRLVSNTLHHQSSVRWQI